MKDANSQAQLDKDGKLPPAAFVSQSSTGEILEPRDVERHSREFLTGPDPEAPPEIPAPTVYGFGAAYQEFPDEMLTHIDVEKLIYDIKNSGPEVCNATSRSVSHAKTICRIHSQLVAQVLMLATIFVTTSTTAHWQKQNGPVHRRECTLKFCLCTALQLTSL